LKKLILISMGILPMLIFAVQAQPDSLKKYHLHPVRVIAEGEQAGIGNVSIIPAPKNNQSVSEALKQSPGINISYGSRDESNLKIRGFRKNESLILIDGRPLNSGYFGNVDLSKILVNDIAEIRVIKGPASSLYGTSTMGGVINLISKQNEQLLAVESTLSRNLVNSQRISSAQSWGDFRYQFSLSRDERRAFVLSDDFVPTAFENGKVRNHSYQKAWHSQLNTEWLIDDIHEMGFSAGFSTIPYKEIPASIYAWEYGTYKDWYRTNASMSADFVSSEDSNLRGQIYFDAAGDTFERFADIQHQNRLLSSRMETVNLGFAPVYELRKAGILSLGSRAEFRTVKRRDDGAYTDWTANHAVVGNVFAQYERDLGARASISAGSGIGFFGHSKSSEVNIFWEPSAALSYRHSELSSSSLAWGLNSAVPTMRQLFSAENGNPDLQASTAHKLELNHKRSLMKNSFGSISIFYNDVRDLIDRTQAGYVNIYAVKSYGGELALSTSVGKAWDIQAQYSLLQTRGDYKLSDSAPHSLELSNYFSLPWGIDLHTSSSWRSKRESQDNVDIFHPLPEYLIHEIGIGKTWRKLDLGFTLHNILDKDYQSEYGYPAPGRDFTLRLRFGF
jgi:outer membrane cobalamin receptor